MIDNVVIMFAGIFAFATCHVVNTNVDIISRTQWGAVTPKGQLPLQLPVPNVIIHHTATPICLDQAQCAARMRSMQRYHQVEQRWDDIGYNFCVGGDGSVYEGRGWSTLGAHAKGFNTVSLGICLIGEWNSEMPPQRQLMSTRALIRQGALLGHINKTYALFGHRQVRNTICPGNALYSEIRTWDNFSEQSFPAVTVS